MNTKKAGEVINVYLTMTMLSTFAIIIIGAVVLFGCTVSCGLNLWLGITLYFLAVSLPFIILGMKYVKAINSEVEQVIMVNLPKIQTNRQINCITSTPKDAKNMIIDI